MAHASSATVHLKPWSNAARVVASMHMWLIAPAMTTWSTPAARSRGSRSVARNAFGKFFSTTASPARGATAGWISAPAVPGTKNVAPGRTERCRTWTIGRRRSRNAASSRAAFAAAASMFSSDIFPPGK